MFCGFRPETEIPKKRYYYRYSENDGCLNLYVELDQVLEVRVCFSLTHSIVHLLSLRYFGHWLSP